ncbi:hypothetical protein KP509_35G006200 [Ceratopteris richardii]|uniref:Kinesin motor domain-containing protein n=1 Tax=Ceratopteris richardii TaxID=49495 RepID=A0A8T2QCW6_CERRI|nr:hypothetical protein KP509_35G006200 [Ceratopteris richardii]
MAMSSDRTSTSGISPRSATMVRVEKIPSLTTGINKQTSPVINSGAAPPRPKAVSPTISHGKRANRSGKESNGGRIRIAVRLRARNAEELLNDADFGDYVELMPELRRLRLRKNSWDYETYQFDSILSETASQKRVYEATAKDVVESVLDGYNGMIVAYGQTGSGKTYTLGNLGEQDASERGIMVRALEDILTDISTDKDTVTVSYLQLYMESIRDLLVPESENITIAEDAKTGDISWPRATSAEVKDQKSVIELLQTGETNRFSVNKKLKTDASRSHAILLVTVRKSIQTKAERQQATLNENGSSMQILKGQNAATVRSSKLFIVDLAGSDRADKFGNEGIMLEEAKFVNLSLTALGKCVNAVAENSTHIPFKDSNLSRLLRDSFEASLIITIGPSPQHRAETTKAILFGQKIMKLENGTKLKEEFDYKSLSKKLATDLDKLIAENEKQEKMMTEAQEEMQRKVDEAQLLMMDAEKRLKLALQGMATEMDRLNEEHKATISKLEEECSQLENELKKSRETHDTIKELAIAEKEIQIRSERLRNQKDVKECIERYQHEVTEMTRKFESERLQKEKLQVRLQEIEDGMKKRDKLKSENQEQLSRLAKQMEKESRLREEAEKELVNWKSQVSLLAKEETVKSETEVELLKQELEEHRKQKEMLEKEMKILKQKMLHLSYDHDETRKFLDREPERPWSGKESPMSMNRSSHMRETINGQRATIAKLFEQVGLQKILSLLESDDVDVRIHAVKVVANLAAEEGNQEKIVQAGGLSSLLRLLQNSEDEIFRSVAAGAVANLAMNETNQELIMTQGGIELLARTANEAEDAQTLRMVAGAIANLCGNDKLQWRLSEGGGIRALLGMARTQHGDVLAQIARGIANFAKCESRAAAQGQRNGKSLLIKDGALPWIISNATTDSSQVRRHIELALCHLAQHEVNAKDFVDAGGLWELIRISRECSREDIRSLARRTLTSSPTFQAELRRVQRSP